MRPVNDPLAEPWNVLIQRLSKCNSELASVTLWLGHGQNRRRRVVKRRKPHSESDRQLIQRIEEVKGQTTLTTSRGRRIQPPLRYHQIAVPQGPAKPVGGGCKITRGSDNVMCEKGTKKD